VVTAQNSLISLDLPCEWRHIAAARVNLCALTDPERAAESFLAPHECADWRALRHPQRRTEWLAARMCLKSLVMDQLQLTDPRGLSVMKDSRGRPWLCTNPRDVVRGDCSLAHSGAHAAAAWTSNATTRLGIDIEQITPRLHRAAGAFCSHRDTAVACRPELNQLAIWWTLKEAASKAWGQGLGAGLAEIACIETSAGRHRLVHTDGRTLAGWHCAFENSILALGASDPVDGITYVTTSNPRSFADQGEWTRN
jgi:phosphopantetheinyl transferase